MKVTVRVLIPDNMLNTVGTLEKGTIGGSIREVTYAIDCRDEEKAKEAAKQHARSLGLIPFYAVIG